MKTAIHPIMRCLALLIIIHLTMPKWAMAEDLNILLIMVDDLGKEWLGCYGADDVRTPHIDELAAVRRKVGDGVINQVVAYKHIS